MFYNSPSPNPRPDAVHKTMTQEINAESTKRAWDAIVSSPASGVFLFLSLLIINLQINPLLFNISKSSPFSHNLRWREGEPKDLLGERPRKCAYIKGKISDRTTWKMDSPGWFLPLHPTTTDNEDPYHHASSPRWRWQRMGAPGWYFFVYMRFFFPTNFLLTVRLHVRTRRRWRPVDASDSDYYNDGISWL